MHDLNGFQRDCLRVIAHLGEPKGLEIKQVLDREYDGEVHHGRLYPNLDKLEEKGLIIKGKKDDRTNEYSIHDRGRDELELQLERYQDALDSYE